MTMAYRLISIFKGWLCYALILLKLALLPVNISQYKVNNLNTLRDPKCKAEPKGRQAGRQSQ